MVLNKKNALLLQLGIVHFMFQSFCSLTLALIYSSIFETTIALMNLGSVSVQLTSYPYDGYGMVAYFVEACYAGIPRIPNPKKMI